MGIGSIVLLVIIWALIRRFGGLSSSDQKVVNYGFWILLILIVGGTFWHGASAGVMNNAPRSTIDQGTVIERSDYVKEQADKHK
jgi:hypothetical protein